MLAVLNTVTARAIHEFLDHQEEIHTCANKDITHFHKAAIKHQDLICSFNFSTTFLIQFIHSFKSIVFFHKDSVYVQLNGLLKRLFHHHFLLRGPPIIK